MKKDFTDIELVAGRLEGLKLLLDTPENEKTMTNKELLYAISEVEIILECLKITASNKPKFNSTELLLLAHDEWKRREERRHINEESPWVIGFISGFLTDKTWAREYVDKIMKKANE